MPDIFLQHYSRSYF